MKIITRYAANDGSEFTSESACKTYEKLCAKVSKVMAGIAPRFKEKNSCNYENGSGYVQHSAVAVNSVRDKILDIIGTKIDHKWIEESKGGKADPSWVARLVGDYGIRCIDSAWHRFLCIDKQGREWGQPYYASHPEAATDKRLNP